MISLLVPTRHRPHNMEKFSLSVESTTKEHNQVEIVFGVDLDDEISWEKALEIKEKLKVKITRVRLNNDKGINLSYFWNQCYAVSQFPVLGFFGDDVEFQTSGWDQVVQKAFTEDSLILLCPSQGNNKDIIVNGIDFGITLFFTHKKVHEKLGMYLDDTFRRWYMDTLVSEAFVRANKVVKTNEIYIKHNQAAVYKEYRDEVFQRMQCLIPEDMVKWKLPETTEKIKNFTDIIIRLGEEVYEPDFSSQPF